MIQPGGIGLAGRRTLPFVDERVGEVTKALGSASEFANSLAAASPAARERSLEALVDSMAIADAHVAQFRLSDVAPTTEAQQAIAPIEDAVRGASAIVRIVDEHGKLTGHVRTLSDLLITQPDAIPQHSRKLADELSVARTRIEEATATARARLEANDARELAHPDAAEIEARLDGFIAQFAARGVYYNERQFVAMSAIAEVIRPLATSVSASWTQATAAPKQERASAVAEVTQQADALRDAYVRLVKAYEPLESWNLQHAIHDVRVGLQKLASARVSRPIKAAAVTHHLRALDERINELDTTLATSALVGNQGTKLHRNYALERMLRASRDEALQQADQTATSRSFASIDDHIRAEAQALRALGADVELLRAAIAGGDPSEIATATVRAVRADHAVSEISAGIALTTDLAATSRERRAPYLTVDRLALLAADEGGDMTSWTESHAQAIETRLDVVRKLQAIAQSLPELKTFDEPSIRLADQAIREAAPQVAALTERWLDKVDPRPWDLHELAENTVRASSLGAALHPELSANKMVAKFRSMVEQHVTKPFSVATSDEAPNSADQLELLTNRVAGLGEADFATLITDDVVGRSGWSREASAFRAHMLFDDLDTRATTIDAAHRQVAWLRDVDQFTSSKQGWIAATKQIVANAQLEVIPDHRSIEEVLDERRDALAAIRHRLGSRPLDTLAELDSVIAGGLLRDQVHTLAALNHEIDQQWPEAARRASNPMVHFLSNAYQYDGDANGLQRLIDSTLHTSPDIEAEIVARARVIDEQRAEQAVVDGKKDDLADRLAMRARIVSDIN